jgi:hypothetical protein
METLALVILVGGSLGLGVVLARAALARILSIARMTTRPPDEAEFASDKAGLLSPPTRGS